MRDDFIVYSILYTYLNHNRDVVCFDKDGLEKRTGILLLHSNPRHFQHIGLGLNLLRKLLLIRLWNDSENHSLQQFLPLNLRMSCDRGVKSS